MRVASIPALFASAEASSMESASILETRAPMDEPKRSLTRCNNHSLPNGDVPQNRPHVTFHLGIDSSAELIDEQVRGISYIPRKT